MSDLRVSFDDGTTVSLERREAHRLIDLLWAVSARSGSFFAIRKIQCGLAQRESPLALSEVEAGVIRAALHQTKDLPPTLARLHAAIG